MSTFTGRRAKKNARGYRTQCKICLQAIYVDEPAIWLLAPMGLSHVWCS